MAFQPVARPRQFPRATDKDIVGNPSKHVVAIAGRQDRAETVFQIIPSATVEVDSIRVEPGAPKQVSDPIDMSIKGAADIVPR